MKFCCKHIAQSLRLLGLFVTAFLVVANSSFGQDRLAISTIGSDSLSVEPGGIVTVVYKIESEQEAESATYSPTFTVPEGWLTVIGNESVVVKQDKPTIRQVLFKIPKNTLSGSYSVQFALSDNETNTSASSQSVVFVKKVYALRFDSDPTEGFVPAGKTVFQNLYLSNEGNTPITAQINAHERRYAGVQLPKGTIQLAPGESQKVEVIINTDVSITQSELSGIRFEAFALEDPAQKAFKTTSFEIVPVYSRIKAKSIGVPISLGVSTIGDDDGIAPQVQVATGFNLLGGNVAVSAVVSEQPRRKLFQADQMVSVAYNRKNVAVQLGDHSQSLSPMTMNSELGRGVSTEISTGDWKIATTVQKSRLTSIPAERAGFSVTKSFSPTSFSSLNVLHRNGLHSGTVGTLRSVSQPLGPASRMDVECGISSDSSLLDPSCSLSASQGFESWSYKTKIQSASTTYPSAIAGTRHISESVNVRLSRTLRLDNSLSFTNRDVGLGYSRNNVHTKTGITYSSRIKGGTFIAAGHGVTMRTRYKSQFETLSRQETMLRLSGGYHRRITGFTFTYEQGFVFDDKQPSNSTFRRFKSSARQNIKNGWSINGSFEMAKGSISAMQGEQTQMMVGLGTNFQLPGGIAIGASGIQSRITSTFSQQYASFRTQLSKTFRSGHLVTAKAQFNQSKGRIAVSSSDYVVTYTAPLSAPFGGKKGDNSLLKGKVIDELTGAPVSDVLIFMGDHVSLTDENGHFAIPRRTDVSEFLRIDQRSIGFDRVSNILLPLEITPFDFQEGEILIPLGPAASLKGSIRVFGYGNESNLLGAADKELTDIGGLPLAVVEIRNETHQFRTRASVDGFFEFNQLPEGSYEVSIVRSQLEDYQRFSEPTISINIKSDTTNSVQFKVLPIKRQIKLIKSTSLSNQPVAVNNKVSTTNQNQTTRPANVPTRTKQKSGLSGVNKNTATAGVTIMQQPDWLLQVKTSAMETSEQVQSGVAAIPYYLDVIPSHSTPAYVTPVYVTMLILSILFFLTAIESLVRNFSGRQYLPIRNFNRPSWIWAYRQSAIYAVLLVGSGMFAGTLGALSIALGLAGVSLTLESKDQYKNIIALTLLTLRYGVRVGAWVGYQQSVAKVLQLSVNTVTIILQNGKSISISPWALLRVSIWSWKPTEVRNDSTRIAVSRFSNLRLIRSIVEDVSAEFAPDGTPLNVHVQFEDINSSQTWVVISTVINAGENTLQQLNDRLEHEFEAHGIEIEHPDQNANQITGQLPHTKPLAVEISTTKRAENGYPALRLIKGGSDKAA